MVAFESCPKHNMVAYLEKTEGNAQFHEIVDFLSRSSIFYALTISPNISTSLIKQFWNSAVSQTVNNVSQIKATVSGKTALISESSIRKDLLFNDDNGIHCLTVADIYENLPLMGYERDLTTLTFRNTLEGTGGSEGDQGRKNAKRGPTLDDSAFDNLDADLAHGMDYMDTEEAVNEGRQSKETEELNVTHDTEVLEKGGSNEEPVNAAGNIGVSTVVPEVSTVNISTASRPEVSTATPMTPPTTTSVFDNEDITLAETLVKMKDDKAKLKGVAIKEVEESDRPARSVLTLKPLPKIDPKDKGKGVLEEEPEPAKKLKKSDLDAAQLAMDEEVARQVNAKLQAELERERVAAEEATQAVLASEFDEIQARMNADTLLAERLQEAEREQFTVEQRAKFLHDTIAAQRKFLAEQRAVAIRSKPLTKTQLRNQMITFLKYVGRYTHSKLRNKKFEEVQVLYEKAKKSIQDFVPIGSAEDERLIEKMNKGFSWRCRFWDLEEKEYLKDFSFYEDSSN
ncbi:hypothetical protein Tco_0643507 [Tanacetum coccineum]